jgi:hypothetical protein
MKNLSRRGFVIALRNTCIVPILHKLDCTNRAYAEFIEPMITVPEDKRSVAPLNYHGSLFMDEGIHGFDSKVREKTVRNVGDGISFIPSLSNVEYRKSFKAAPYLQHIAFDIYKLRFKPIGLHYVDWGPQCGGCYLYVIETYPNLKFCHTVLTHEFKRRNFHLHQWYEGYGLLSNRGFPDGNQHHSLFDGLTISGQIDEMFENHLCRDFGNYAGRVKKFRYGKDVYCYEDALQWYGYYDNLTKFKDISSRLMRLARRFDTIEPESNAHSIIYRVTI